MILSVKKIKTTEEFCVQKDPEPQLPHEAISWNICLVYERLKKEKVLLLPEAVGFS